MAAGFSIAGTGEGRFEFEIAGGECPVEVYEFSLTSEEVKGLLDGLWAAHFFRLEAHYSGQPGVMVDEESGGRLIEVVTMSFHASDVTVTVRLGDFAHSPRCRG